jgi:hypothetical protein
MSEFVAAFLVLVALAAVGSFAGNPDPFNAQCAGWFCW